MSLRVSNLFLYCFLRYSSCCASLSVGIFCYFLFIYKLLCFFAFLITFDFDNSLSNSSIVGKLAFSFSGIDRTILYSETPIGLLISLREYSAMTLSFLLHKTIPIDGLSSLCLSEL